MPDAAHPSQAIRAFLSAWPLACLLAASRPAYLPACLPFSTGRLATDELDTATVIEVSTRGTLRSDTW